MGWAGAESLKLSLRMGPNLSLSLDWDSGWAGAAVGPGIRALLCLQPSLSSRCGIRTWMRVQIAIQGGGASSGDNFVGKFVFKEGGKFFACQNSGVSAGARAHARGSADLPAQGSLERVGGVRTPIALLEPARVLLGWEDGAPPQQNHAAGGRRRSVRWGLPVYHAQS